MAASRIRRTFVQLPDVGPFQALRHEVRCVPAYDECPGSLTYPEEPHVGEYPDGFAYRGTADSEDAHQFRFGGKFLSDAESACGNLFLESCRQLFSQRFFPYGGFSIIISSDVCAKVTLFRERCFVRSFFVAG